MDSLNHHAALRLAQAKVYELAFSEGEEFEILAGETREVEQGWVFFYNTADYVRTGDPLQALAGNGPVLVLRSGRIAVLPSAISWQDELSKMPQAAGGRAD
jgi:hypothetical protein